MTSQDDPFDAYLAKHKQGEAGVADDPFAAYTAKYGASEPDPDFSDVTGGTTKRKRLLPTTQRGGPGPNLSVSPSEFGMAALRGSTLGFGDEALNAVRALPAAVSGDETYPDRFVRLQAESDSAQQAFAKREPGRNLAIQLGAGLATAGPALPRTFGSVANNASTMAKVGGAIKRIGAAGAIGTTVGGVSGAGEPGPDQTRLESGAQGAVVGGVLGAGAGTLSQVAGGVRSLARRIAGRSTPAEIAGRFADEAGVTELSSVMRANAMEAQGKPATVADALGPTGLRMGQATGGASPEAADKLAAFGAARTAKSVASGEVTRDIAVATGITPKPTILTQRIIDQARKDMSSKVYPVLRADARPISDQGVRDALQTDLGREAYQRAQQMAHTDAQVSGVTGRARAPFINIFDAKGRLVRDPNLATIDWIKRAMDKMTKPPKMGIPGVGRTLDDDEMAALGEIRKAMLRRLDDLGTSNPTLAAYTKVRGEQEQAFAVVDAMQRGLKRFKASSIPDGAVTDDLVQIAREASGRGTDGALLKAAYQQAGMDALTARLRSGTLTKAEELSTIRNLRAMGITAQQVDDLLGRIQFTQERQRVGETFKRLLGGGADPATGNEGAAFGDIATGNTAGGFRNLFKSARNRMGEGLTRSNAPAVADVLQQPAQPFLQQMGEAQRGAFAKRNAFGKDALAAYLLGQQAGRP